MQKDSIRIMLPKTSLQSMVDSLQSIVGSGVSIIGTELPARFAEIRGYKSPEVHIDKSLPTTDCRLPLFPPLNIAG